MPETPQIPEAFEALLRPIRPARLLDVATGVGQFVGLLAEHLGGFDEIIGIDTSEKAIEQARAQFNDPRIHFECADAERMPYPDDSFDAVAISNSLHHMEDLPSVLAEMRRVLAPHADWIVMEMHDDATTPGARNALDLHRWAAAVDRALGRYHEPVWGRSVLLSQLDALGLADFRTAEWASDSFDLNAEAADRMAETIDRILAQAKGTPNAGVLSDEAERLIERIRSEGIGQQPFLLAVGRQRPA